MIRPKYREIGANLMQRKFYKLLIIGDSQATILFLPTLHFSDSLPGTCPGIGNYKR